ncbi:unnamed protein product [Diamesa serratosioi]
MLQALGTNTRTKVSGYILFGCACLAVFAIFFADMERTSYDESYAYCSTIYWSQKTGYRIEFWGRTNDLENVSNGVARACYKDQKLDNGLSFLEIESQAAYPDKVQAYAVGMLEGTMTWMNIYSQWVNTIQSFCDKNEKFCIWLRDVIKNNQMNIMAMAEEKGSNDHYLYQIQLFYYQLAGLELGFQKGVKRARKDYEIPTEDFLLLNSPADIEDLKLYYNAFVDEEADIELDPTTKSKMILKILDHNGKANILFGHSTAGDYNAMLKIVKKYRFRYHYGPGLKNNLVTNTDITFTSYPGCIASTDDFYILRGKQTKLLVGGVRILNNNSNLLRSIDFLGTVFMSARVMAANRLAHNGKSFSKILSRDPGLGAKQWLVVDAKRMKNVYAFLKQQQLEENQEQPVTSATTSDDGIIFMENDLSESSEESDLVNFEKTAPAFNNNISNNQNLIWLVDQAYGRLHAEDVTSTYKFNSNEYWILDGNPYFQQIHEISGTQQRSIQRTEVIQSIDGVEKILRYHSFRGDLLGDHNKMAFGNVDIKLYSDHAKFKVQSGPVYSVNDTMDQCQPTVPFEWTSSNFNDVRHDEHPTLWNFPMVKVQFAWN